MDILVCVALAGGILALLTTLGGAQEVGSRSAGYDLARSECSACHAIEPDAPVSPNSDAPPFSEVAANPQMTEMALAVWFRSPHETMPNFVIAPDESSDLIAYILGLRTP